MPTPEERRRILDELDAIARTQLEAAWRAAESAEDFRAYMFRAYPELAQMWYSVAADLAANWYLESAPDRLYTPEPAIIPADDRFTASLGWALTNNAARDLLIGSLTRTLFDGYRDTVRLNAEQEPGARYARYASQNACGFCRMLVTRHVGPNATFYASKEAATRVVGRGKEMSLSDRRDRAAGRTRRSSGQFLAGGRKARGTQQIGDRFHDNCKCTYQEIRPGQEYEPMPWVEQWNRDYIEASKISSDPHEISKLMTSR